MLVIAWCLGLVCGALFAALLAYVGGQRERRRPLPAGCIGRCPSCSTPVALRFHEGTPEGVQVDVLFPGARP